MMHDGEKDALRCCYERDRNSGDGKSLIAWMDIIGDDHGRQRVQQCGNGQQYGRGSV